MGTEQEHRAATDGSPRRIRVAMIDDHPTYVHGLKTLLESIAPDVEVVAVATAAEAGIEAVVASQPDVVLLDLRMPDLDGVEVAKKICALCPASHVVALTGSDDSDDVVGMMRAGARGYIRKDIDPDKLVSAVRAVAAGEVVLATFASKVIFEDGMRSAPRLSDYDIELLRLIGSGKSYAEVAATLAVSESTLKRQLADIQKALGVDNKIQAVAYLARKGLL